MSAFSRKFKAVRKQLGYSQRELAEALDVDVMTISRWERAERNPPLAKLVLMAVGTLEPKRKGGR